MWKSFLDRYIRAIFLGEHKLVPRHLRPVAVITKHSALVSLLKTPKGQNEFDLNISIFFNASKKALTALCTKRFVQANKSNHELVNTMPIEDDGKLQNR